jgi:hypothetical protein
MRATINLVCHYGVTSGVELLHHYLDHYHRLGVDRFFFILHGAPEDRRTIEASALLQRYGVETLTRVDDFSTPIKLQRYNTIRKNHLAGNDWVIYADADELQVYPAPLHEFAAGLEARGIDFAAGAFHDRVARGGVLAPISREPSIWEQFPYVTPATERIAQGWTRKVCLIKARLELAEGGAHAVAFHPDNVVSYGLTHASPRCGAPVQVHHFKWDHTLGERLANKLRRRAGDRESIDGAGFIGEYERLAMHIHSEPRLRLDGFECVGVPPLHYERDPFVPGQARSGVPNTARARALPAP